MSSSGFGSISSRIGTATLSCRQALECFCGRGRSRAATNRASPRDAVKGGSTNSDFQWASQSIRLERQFSSYHGGNVKLSIQFLDEELRLALKAAGLLVQGYAQDSVVSSILDEVDGNYRRNMKSTSAEDLAWRISKQEDIVKYTLANFENLKLGKHILGRCYHPSRFEWAHRIKAIAAAARGKKQSLPQDR